MWQRRAGFVVLEEGRTSVGARWGGTTLVVLDHPYKHAPPQQ
jgi:hypothetical protein